MDDATSRANTKVLSDRGDQRRRKVKSGCRTCKARKVKCDETRPVCNRCKTTKRICEGYGIWGGGNVDANRDILQCQSQAADHPQGQRQREQRPSAPRARQPQQRPKTEMTSLQPKLASSGDRLKADERTYYNWFLQWTILKIPGCFDSAFWDHVVVQATYSEQAVWHAVLALAAAHKRDCVIKCAGRAERAIGRDSPEALDQFTLWHYSRAIQHLNSHPGSGKRSSIRVALISCVLFSCMEYLRGNFTTGNWHLTQGLRLLAQKPADSSKALNLLPPAASDPVDGSLTQIMHRMSNQAALHGQVSLSQAGLAWNLDPTKDMHTIGQARQLLVDIIGAATRLSEDCRSEAEESPAERYKPSRKQEEYREYLQTSIAQWNRTFEESRERLLKSMDGVTGTLADQILRSQRVMAKIMVETATAVDNEMVYDDFGEEFSLFLEECIGTHKAFFLTDLTGTTLEICFQVSHFVTDSVWVVPLYYLAVKCRDHRIRYKALELLDIVPLQEGTWSSSIAATIVRRVIHLEENDVEEPEAAMTSESKDGHAPSKALEQDDSLSPSAAYPSPASTASVTVIPESRRLNNVQVTLPKEGSEETVITFRRRREDGTWDRRRNVYDPLTERWREVFVKDL